MHNELTDVLLSIYMAYSTYHTVDRCAPQKQATTMAGGGLGCSTTVATSPEMLPQK